MVAKIAVASTEMYANCLHCLHLAPEIALQHLHRYKARHNNQPTASNH